MSAQEQKDDIPNISRRAEDEKVSVDTPGHTRLAAHSALVLAVLAILLTIGLYFHEQAADKTFTADLQQTQTHFDQRMEQTEQKVESLSKLPETLRRQTLRLALEEMAFSAALLHNQMGSQANQGKLQKIQTLIKELKTDLKAGAK
jgi:hypothetical protein